MALMPMLGRLRVLRSWGGIMDMSMDGSPIIDRTPSTGSISTPAGATAASRRRPASGWCFAHLIARGRAAPGSNAAYAARPVRDRRADRREGRGRAAEPALRTACASPVPICGERDNDEFSYLGDAPAAPDPQRRRRCEACLDYVYLRDNPAGAHRELWHHVAGCRHWLVVTRDTRTHEILGRERWNARMHADSQGRARERHRSTACPPAA